MNTLHPVEELMEEHRAIEEMLIQLEERLAGSEAGPFPAEFIGQALDFFQNFADGVHHYKEEEALFPLLAAKGVAVEGGPIGVMLQEHAVGRTCLAGIRGHLPEAAAGSTEARQKIREHAKAYTDMLRQHIWKEDHVLFEIARRTLSEGDTARLLDKMHHPPSAKASPEVRSRYLESLALTPARRP
jgi:hemerythrin-like domain-containing protein